MPVGNVVLDETITPLIERAWELLGYSDAMEALAAAYQPGRTFAQAFAEFYSKVFGAQGLLVLDAGSRDFHRLGAPVLRAAIERADELHAALIERNNALRPPAITLRSSSRRNRVWSSSSTSTPARASP